MNTTRNNDWLRLSEYFDSIQPVRTTGDHLKHTRWSTIDGVLLAG